MFGVMDQIEEVRKRRRAIVERRLEKLDELGAFDEEGRVIPELLDDEARELGAERGRLTRQLFELISQDQANHAIHSELMVCNFEIIFAITIPFFHTKLKSRKNLINFVLCLIFPLQLILILHFSNMHASVL